MPPKCKSLKFFIPTSLVEFRITGYYGPGLLRDAWSQDTDLYPIMCPFHTFLSHHVTTIYQRYRQTDWRHCISARNRAKMRSAVDGYGRRGGVAMATSTCRLPIQVMMGRYWRRDGTTTSSSSSRPSRQRAVDGRVAARLYRTVAVRLVGVRMVSGAKCVDGGRLVQEAVFFGRPLLHRHVHCSPTTLLTHHRPQS